ncbi:MAG: hypothetical protein V4692_09440 [Bdellovibrionota bacterium]
MKLLRFVRNFASILGLVFTVGHSAFAQSGAAGGSEINVYMGTMLPNQIDGVDEILPVFGGRYSFDTNIGMIELGGTNSHARGIDFTTIEANLRHDVPIDEGVIGLIGGGLDFNWYIPKNESSRKAETGFNITAGGMMSVSQTFWLRTDLKFMGGPGTSLTLLFGFVFRDDTAGN